MATTNANFPTADRTMPRRSMENISEFQSSKEHLNGANSWPVRAH
jgi:hypothetical protein